jgi:DNA-binding CsgD family transcriptional regulator
LGLSKREAEVLNYVAMGKTDAEFAIILEVSRLTVSKDREHILPPLGVETRTAAAALAIVARAQMVSCEDLICTAAHQTRLRKVSERTAR